MCQVFLLCNWASSSSSNRPTLPTQQPRQTQFQHLKLSVLPGALGHQLLLAATARRARSGLGQLGKR